MREKIVLGGRMWHYFSAGCVRLGIFVQETTEVELDLPITHEALEIEPPEDLKVVTMGDIFDPDRIVLSLPKIHAHTLAKYISNLTERPEVRDVYEALHKELWP